VTTPSLDALRQRVLLLLATTRDAELTRDLLERNGIAAHACADADALATELARGVGAVLVSEECLSHGGQSALAHALEAQPRWSDLPVLLLTRGGADSLEVGDAVALLHNVTLLERPLRVAALVSTVTTALRARARQYEIQQHLRELEIARDLEVEAVRRKDEFLAMLAHELRNPLAPIRNALHVLSVDDSDAARRKQLRSMMSRQVDHMVRLVDDLLEASRLSRGMITLDCQPLDLRDALQRAIEQSTPQIERGGHVLMLDLPDEPLPVCVDPVRIAQVFGNLLNNAAKFGRDGHISVVGRREGNDVVVRISDDGAGIEPEMLPRVFDLFAQGPRRADGGMPEGLGIGLALVHTLVGLHGGTVQADSDGPGRGATFTVRLPRGEPAAAVDTPLVSTQPNKKESLRILVVDDNVDAAASLAMVLETLHVAPRLAHDGAEALRITATYHPHVVLLDIGMPTMDGCEVARRIRSDDRNGQPVLVAVTGWSHEQDRERTTAAGFDYHFAKPVDIAKLDALLAGIRSANRTGARARGGEREAASGA